MSDQMIMVRNNILYGDGSQRHAFMFRNSSQYLLHMHRIIAIATRLHYLFFVDEAPKSSQLSCMSFPNPFLSIQATVIHISQTASFKLRERERE